ncbi:MAG: nucleotide sugar dehydrogenase [Anaerolineales bacterium]|nr:nucleotide sugar dehydrogenase [Anaerolineales bacterium]
MTESPETDLPASARQLIEKLETGDATVGVVGLGYVGLPLAVLFAESGYRVLAVDVSPSKVESLNRGESYVEDVASERVAQVVEAGRFEATTSYQALTEADAVSICVPTPLRKTGDPDLTFIITSAQELGPHLHAGQVIVLESTTYPGTTREMVLPELERGGLEVGEDIFLAFSPERVDPGRSDWTTENTPKVIGGVTAACTAVASAFYGRAIQKIVQVSSAEVAEMTKLLENTFRAVNIGMANEMALMCDRLGIDVWEVIDAAATKPFGFMKFTPGPGLGGHCIPIDPLYLSWKLKSVKYNARFIELASEINTNMPRYVVSRLQDALNDRERSVKGSRLLILGVAYKPGVSDTRESPALDIIGLLLDKGADVRYYDPYVPTLTSDDWELQSEDDLDHALGEADGVVVVTDHAEINYREVAEAAEFVFDTRNAVPVDGDLRPKVVRL